MMSIDLLTVIQIVVLVVILLVGLELILRYYGFKPLTIERERSKITPEGKYYKADPVLGFVHQPGDYQLEIDGRFTFSARHNSRGHRVTGNNKTEAGHENKPKIWIFGCSFAYGWLLEDHETFPWLIQEKLPSYEVENFGVNGYGNLQSYLQCKQAVETDGKPEVVILAFGSMHVRRNTVTRLRRKSVSRLDRASPFVVPCARLGINGKLKFKKIRMAYRSFPLARYSALINFIEFKYSHYSGALLKSEEVTKRVLDKFNKYCDENNITFVVASILGGESTRRIMEFCEKKDMLTVDISVPRGAKHPEHTHYPHDDHPSALANRKYADKIIEYLKNHNLQRVNL